MRYDTKQRDATVKASLEINHTFYWTGSGPQPVIGCICCLLYLSGEVLQILVGWIPSFPCSMQPLLQFDPHTGWELLKGRQVDGITMQTLPQLPVYKALLNSPSSFSEYIFLFLTAWTLLYSAGQILRSIKRI